MKLLNLFINNKTKIFTIADQALVSGGNFVFSIFTARFLGLRDYGVFILTWMTVLFLSSIQQAYILSPMANITSAHSEEQKLKYTESLLFIQLTFGILSSLLLFSYIYIYTVIVPNNYLSKSIYILPLSVFAYLFHDFFRKKFFLINKTHLSFILDLIVNLTLLISSIFLITIKNSKGDILDIMEVMTLSYFTGCIIGFLLQPNFRFKFCKDIMNKHWMSAKWLLLTSMLIWFSGNYFIIAAGTILGPKEAGIIRIAQALIGVLNIFFIALEAYIPISASKIFFLQGRKALFEYLSKVAIKGLAVTLIFCLFIYIFSKEIIQLLYGYAYQDSVYVVQWFTLFYILVFTAIPLRFALRTLEQDRNIFIAYCLSTLFSLLCADMMVSHMGMVGVIAGLITTQLITQFWYILSLKNYYYEHSSFGTWKS